MFDYLKMQLLVEPVIILIVEDRTAVEQSCIAFQSVSSDVWFAFR